MFYLLGERGRGRELRCKWKFGATTTSSAPSRCFFFSFFEAEGRAPVLPVAALACPQFSCRKLIGFCRRRPGRVGGIKQRGKRDVAAREKERDGASNRRAIEGRASAHQRFSIESEQKLAKEGAVSRCLAVLSCVPPVLRDLEITPADHRAQAGRSKVLNLAVPGGAILFNRTFSSKPRADDAGANENDEHLTFFPFLLFTINSTAKTG